MSNELIVYHLIFFCQYKLWTVKGLVVELTPPHAQSAWESRGKEFELRG